MLAPLDDTLRERAFLLGRIGYPISRYTVTLVTLAFTGKIRFRRDSLYLRAFFGRWIALPPRGTRRMRGIEGWFLENFEIAACRKRLKARRSNQTRRRRAMGVPRRRRSDGLVENA